jgi:hypothetical protein
MSEQDDDSEAALPTGDDQRRRRQDELLDELFGGLPDDPARCHAALVDLSHRFHEALARAYERPLNERLQAMPMTTASEQQDLAVEANRLMRELRLAVRVPDRPDTTAILGAHLERRRGATTSVFRFQTRGSDNARSWSGWHKRLPELSLVPAPIRPENFTRSGRERWCTAMHGGGDEDASPSRTR